MKIGDKVILKSGGPIMTVTNTYKGAGEIEMAECAWFDDHPDVRSPHSMPYPVAALDPAEEEPREPEDWNQDWSKAAP